MSYKIEAVLPRPDEVKKKLPRTEKMATQVALDRQEIYKILNGESSRKLLIVGPCSAWKDNDVISYAEKLAKLNNNPKIKEKIKLVLRVYTQKPRTTIGWTGPLNQPDPYEESDITKGIYYCREMMLKCVEMGLPIADEALFTHNDGYFVDLLSWVAIGARSSEDQEHRIFSSMIDHPVGMKNPTSGNLKIAINSIISAQSKHVFSLHGRQIKTSGNSYAHLILRGGDGQPNFSQEKLQKATKLLIDNKIENPAIIVDVSHENCIDPETGKKDANLQPGIIQDILNSVSNDENINKVVKGFMVESFLQGGNQNLNNFEKSEDLENGKSVTDPCLDWEKTEQMIFDLVKKL